MKKQTKQRITRVAFPALVLGLALTGADVASAHGVGGVMKGNMGVGAKDDPVQMFQDQAVVLGVTVDDVKNAWASGKDLMTFAKEKGLTEQTVRAKMHAQQESQMKVHLAAQVKAGRMTQAQADEIVAHKAKKDAEMQQVKATALGISVADLQSYQSAGKTVTDIIKEKGLNSVTVHKSINTGMQSVRIAEETARIQDMVTRGVITQEQANKRIETIKTNTQNPKAGTKKAKGMRGHGDLMGF